MPVSVSRPAALVISPEAPYPLDGGGALRTASLLHALADRYEVDLLAFRHPGQRILENLPPDLVRSTGLIELRAHANTVPARVMRNAGRLLRGVPPLVDRFSGYESAIARELEGKAYDTVLLEHFWSASYIPLVRRFARRVILDLHNVESAWHASCAAASAFPQSLMHRGFGRAALRLEQRWLPLFDIVLTASSGDADRVRAIAPQSRVCIYPNAIPFRETIAVDQEFAIAFSGNMEYEPNRDGVDWFLREVWPGLKARFPSLGLQLIGKNDHALSAAARTTPGVTATGWIADPFARLSAVQVCIAPLRSGSGTRLKIIEAWAAQRAVVSTGIGAEGLDAVDGESILLADSAELFGAAVTRLLLDEALKQKIAKTGRELYLQKYTWNVVSRTLNGCLDSPIS